MAEIDNEICGTCHYFRCQSPDGRVQFAIESDYGVCRFHNSPEGLIVDQRVTPRQALISYGYQKIVTKMTRQNSTCHEFAGPIMEAFGDGLVNAFASQSEPINADLPGNVFD